MKNAHPILASPRQLDIWNTLSRQVYIAQEIALFLDYDGTLTPIRKTPNKAIPAPGTISLLRKLIQLPHLTVFIVTGRSMEDIRQRIPLENMGFIANHGFHILRDGNEWKHPGAIQFKWKLQKLHTLLQNTLKPFQHAFIEDKQFTLSIHYRNVPSREKYPLKTTAAETIGAYDSTLLTTEGKEVLEVRPPLDWGKGRAVMKVLKSSQHSPHSLQIYIGDDETDEDAFHVLQSSGMTLHVGRISNTYAQYYMPNVGEVLRFLKMILAMRTHHSNHHFTPEKNKKGK
jgi:trehalose 6-phosphate phosphatase